MWRALLPEGNARLDCAQLAAESHGFGAARISGCIYQAAASLVLEENGAGGRVGGSAGNGAAPMVVDGAGLYAIVSIAM